MNDILILVENNLIKVSIGVILFLGAYLANMGLGAWRNVKINGFEFDIKLIANSLIKFIVLGLCIALLVMVISVIPSYATYVGIIIDTATLEAIDSIVIIGSFLAATLRYIADAIDKLKDIL